MKKIIIALIVLLLAAGGSIGAFLYAKNKKNEDDKAAERKKLNPQVHDSFFMALDVNTTEDLGEIMIHGDKTHTRRYLKELKVTFEPFRGSERIKVTRDE